VESVKSMVGMGVGEWREESIDGGELLVFEIKSEGNGIYLRFVLSDFGLIPHINFIPISNCAAAASDPYLIHFV